MIWKKKSDQNEVCFDFVSGVQNTLPMRSFWRKFLVLTDKHIIGGCGSETPPPLSSKSSLVHQGQMQIKT